MPAELDSTQLYLRLEPTTGAWDVKPVTIQRRGAIVVGRSSSTHLRLPKFETIYSRLHFVVEFNSPKCRILDLGSRTGTFVNNQKVFTAYLNDGDEIRVGKTILRVRIAAELPPLPPSTESPADELAFQALEKERERKLAARKTKIGSKSKPKSKSSARSSEKTKKSKYSKEERIARRAARRAAGLSEGSAAESSAIQKPLVPAKPVEQMVKTTTAHSNPETTKPPSVVAKAASTAAGKKPHESGLNFDLQKLLEGDSSENIPQPPELKEQVEHAQQMAKVKVPGYELIESLGQGNLGEVFRARKEDDGKTYAVKLLHSERVGDSAAVDAFFLELRPLVELEHNHLVRYREFGVTKDYVFVVSDFVEGSNVDETIKDEGAMGVVRMAKLGCQLLHALDYTHGLGYVHRDIKPSNIIITSENNREICKLTDFGLARTFQNSPLYGVKRKSDLERSVRFMAPEQFQNFKEMPLSVDIYSMAAAFYFMLTGKYTHDFESLSFDQSVNKIKRDDAYNINRRRMDIPGELANLIHQGLQRFPQKRITSAAAFRRDLFKFIK